MSHYTNQNASRPNIVLAHALRGEQVESNEGFGKQASIQRAGLHSTAPYKPPKRRKRDNPDKQLCSSEGCGAYPMKGLDYCTGHARSLGLVDFGRGKGFSRKVEIIGDSG